METYLVTVSVNVEDARALIDYADVCTEAACFESVHNLVEEGETLVERALMEALIISNENPSPVDYGISFNEISCQKVWTGEPPRKE
jgi:hypothetical protein